MAHFVHHGFFDGLNQQVVRDLFPLFQVHLGQQRRHRQREFALLVVGALAIAVADGRKLQLHLGFGAEASPAKRPVCG